MNVDGVISNLLQGISQQQPYARLPGQCTNQVNAVADVVDGWKRRPPAEFIARLGNAVHADSVWHFYDTGLEQYFMCVQPNGTLSIYDLAGVAYTAAGASGLTAKLAFTNPEELSLVTIGDYTIIANRNLTPAFATTNKEAYTNTALVYLKDGGEYGRKYTINLDGVEVAEFTTPGGSNPDLMAPMTGTEYVAERLMLDLTALASTVYDFARAGSIIEIKRKSTTGFIDVKCTDDRGGQFAKVIQREAKKPGDLPKYATPNQIVKVTGEGTSDKDDYFLKFTIEEGTSAFGTEGVWRECCEPGLTRELNSATMPHALVRLPDGSWVFTAIDGSTKSYTGGTYTVERWRYRSAGSETSNPTPAFIGQSIAFAGTFQDRLYFLSGEGAVFSATNSYFNFFNKTGLTILDSDPVDMPSAGNAIAVLERAVLHDKTLVIFSDKAQFIVPGSVPITPKSSMILTTAYDSELRCTPVVAGSSILFPITYGNYSGLREFITTDITNTNSAQPITANVPKLISGAIKTMQVSSNFDTVIVQSTASTKQLYIFEYLWQDGQRVQAAWGIWEFDNTISTVFIKDANVYVVLNNGSSMYLKKIDLTDVAPTGMPCNIFLDSRKLITPVANTVTVPYVAAVDNIKVVQGPDCSYPGKNIPVVSVATVGTTTVITLGETPEDKCFVGKPMRTLYIPTMPLIKDQAGGLINNARFVIGRMFLSYKDTGGFDVTVKNPHYPDYIASFSGRVLGSPTNILGELSVHTGTFEIPVRQDAKTCTIEIETSSYLPMNLTSLEWNGDYTKRGRRL